MTETLTSLEELAIEPQSERRHQPRVNFKYPIEVCGFSRHGRYFTEKTFTLDISDGGCRFRLRNEVEKGSVVAIRLINRRHGREADTRPILFNVNWFQAQPNAWTMGVSKLQAGAAWCASISEDAKFAGALA
jgi:hypothetical protein